MDFRNIIAKNPVLAILRNVPEDIVLEYGEVIRDGGISFYEVALNSRGAFRQIERLRERFGGSGYIGAGTVLNVEDAKKAVTAGAQFLLSPSVNEAVLEYCAANEIAMLPGAMTPSEIALCLRYGFSVIKLFPAGFMAPGYLQAVKGPLEQADFIAIGGVTRTNAADFLREGYLGVGMGSSLLPEPFESLMERKAAVASLRQMIHSLRERK